MKLPGHERRQEPRYSASLPYTISLLDDESDILFPDAKLEGFTKDLSETGVGLTAASIYLGYTCIIDEDRNLRVGLMVNDTVVEMIATPVHYLRLDDGVDGASYLIGLRIREMSEESRSRYNSYLRSLD